MGKTWICPNCQETNDKNFDICWNCGYGMDGKSPLEIESELYDVNEKRKKSIDKSKKEYKKKRRMIILLIFLPLILGFINFFIQKDSAFNATHPLLKKVKYDIQDLNESKTISIDWSKEYDSCLWVGLQNPSSDFTDYLIRGQYKLEIFDANNNLLKSVNLYHNRNSIPSNANIYEEYGFYFINVPFQKKFYNLKIKLTTRVIPKSFHKITSNTYMVLREARGSCPRNSEDVQKQLNREQDAEISIQREEHNNTLGVLYKALKNKNFTRVQSLLENDFSINVMMHGDRKPIHYAAYFNDTETLEYLIDNGVSIYQKDALGYTPTQYAIGHNSLDTLKLLISKGADIREIYNVPDLSYGGLGQDDKIFYFMTDNCDLNLAEIILESGVDINDDRKYKSYSIHGTTILDYLKSRQCSSKLTNPINKNNFKAMEKLYREYGALTGEELQNKQ